MTTNHEHDDDLEPEVIEGEEIESERYVEDEESPEPRANEKEATHPSFIADEEKFPAVDDEEEQDEEAGDSI